MNLLKSIEYLFSSWGEKACFFTGRIPRDNGSKKCKISRLLHDEDSLFFSFHLVLFTVKKIIRKDSLITCVDDNVGMVASTDFFSYHTSKSKILDNVRLLTTTTLSLLYHLAFFIQKDILQRLFEYKSKI